jgi:hypothetical protein
VREFLKSRQDDANDDFDSLRAEDRESANLQKEWSVGGAGNDREKEFDCHWWEDFGFRKERQFRRMVWSDVET